MEHPEQGVALARDHQEYYEESAQRNKTFYVSIKVLGLLAAAVIPIFSLTENLLVSGPLVAAGLGAVVVVLEGVQQLFRFHDNWTNYRAACEAIRRELFLYTSRAGPYAEAHKIQAAESLLADRIAGVTGQAVSKWLSTQEKAAKAGTASSG